MVPSMKREIKNAQDTSAVIRESPFEKSPCDFSVSSIMGIEGTCLERLSYVKENKRKREKH